MADSRVDLQGWELNDFDEYRGNRKINVTVTAPSPNQSKKVRIRLEDLSAVELDLIELRAALSELA